MADRTPRIAWDNAVWMERCRVTASAELPTHPARRLLNTARGDDWRTPVGWTIGSANAQLVFTEGASTRIGTLVTGAYATGTDLAAAVQTALNAAPSVSNAYAVSYSVTTHKFTLTRSSGSAAFALPADQGIYSCSVDLGFVAGRAYTGATSYEATFPAYQSRHWVDFDFGPASVSIEVKVGVNDILDFSESGVGALYAQVAGGLYVTPDDLAAAVQVALNGAIGVSPSVNTYTFAWNSTAQQFTLSRATGSATVTLLAATGASVSRGLWSALGFPPTDVTGTFFQATSEVWGWPVPYYVIALSTNVDGGIGIISRTSAPDNVNEISAYLAGSRDLAILLNESAENQAERYLRIVVDNVRNPDGYTSVPVLYVGDYDEPGHFTIGYGTGADDLSAVVEADYGAVFGSSRPRRAVFTGELTKVTLAQRDQLTVMEDAVGITRPFFFLHDPLNTPRDRDWTIYARLSQPTDWRHSIGGGNPPDRFTATLSLVEVLP